MPGEGPGGLTSEGDALVSKFDTNMADPLLQTGLIRLHILHHASREPVFGLGLMAELGRHGHRLGPGTLYPILHGLEAKGYLRGEDRTVGGRRRRTYRATAKGRKALATARLLVRELADELFEGETP